MRFAGFVCGRLRREFIGKISGRRIFYAAESFGRDTDRWSKNGVFKIKFAPPHEAN